jgi:putative membrane protein
MRGIFNLFVGLIVMSAATPAFSQQRDIYAHGHMWNSDRWFLGPIFMLLLLVTIIAIVMFFFKQAGGSTQDTHTTPIHRYDTSLEILKKRYAKGEIDKDEFELKRKTLES